VSTRTLISVAEFDRLEPPDELRYELDEGELLEMVKPRYNPHNRIARAIDRALLAYLDKNPIGEVLTSDNLFVLGPNTKRIPDLSFMTMKRLRQIKPDTDIEGAPDLAIEVLSPSDTATAMRRKVKQYFAAGSRAVWLVFPESRGSRSGNRRLARPAFLARTIRWKRPNSCRIFGESRQLLLTFTYIPAPQSPAHRASARAARGNNPSSTTGTFSSRGRLPKAPDTRDRSC
jgi:Uma2 family endonuclease